MTMSLPPLRNLLQPSRLLRRAEAKRGATLSETAEGRHLLRSQEWPESPVCLVLDCPAPSAKLVVSKPFFVAGWCFSETSAIERIQIFVGDILLAPLSNGGKRPDVAAAFPTAKQAARSGYSGFVELQGVSPGNHELIVRAYDRKGNKQSVRRPVTLIRHVDEAWTDEVAAIPPDAVTTPSIEAPRVVGSIEAFARRLTWSRHRISLESVADPSTGLIGDISGSGTSWYRLVSSKGFMPSGRTVFSLRVARARSSLLPELYVLDRNAGKPVLAHQFPRMQGGSRVQLLVFLPEEVGDLYLKLQQSDSEFEIRDFSVYTLGEVPLFVVTTIWWLKKQVRDPRRLLKSMAYGTEILLREGPQAFAARLLQARIDRQSNRPRSSPEAREEDGSVPAPREIGLSDATPRAKGDFTAACSLELDRFLASGEVLKLASHRVPAVSIVLVLYNRAELTLACLQSLVDHAGEDYEVIVVDNGSSDRTGAMLRQVAGIRLVENRDNLGFVKACNQGVELARSDKVLLLNNDATLLPGTLASALHTLANADDIGVVGARIVLLDGTLQEAGCIVWRDGSCAGYGRGDFPRRPEYLFQRTVDFCSGAFFLTRKGLWDALDGFDEAFSPAYYEEVDYCIRARRAGWRTVYDPNSIIVHYEFASSSDSARAVALQVRNRSIFAAKHAALLAKQYEASPERVLHARTVGAKSRVLVIDDRVPHIRLGSGCPRANILLQTLVDLGYVVTFYPKQMPEEDWESVYADLPAEIEVMLGYGNQRLESFLESRRGYYQAVVVSRPHNMDDFARIVSGRPELIAHTQVIYDAEAVFTLRDVAEESLLGHTIPESRVNALVAVELSPAKIADQVMVVSQQERQVFLDHGIPSVHRLAHALVPTPTAKGFAQRSGFLFVGSLAAEMSPNVDSILWFLNHVFPRVRRCLSARGESVELRVIGQVTSSALTERIDPGVRFLGLVDDLEPYFDDARVFVAPTRFAAGVPLKIYDAAGHGVPVVATSLLVKQLGWTDGVDLLSSDMSDPETFAWQCVRLYTDKRLWDGLRASALARVEEDCSLEHFSRVVKDILEGGQRANRQGRVG